MNKRTVVTVLASILVIIAACTKKNATNNPNVKPADLNSLMFDSTMTGADSPFIHVDSANKMLNSYLSSINTAERADDLHSLIIDAEALRYYLQNTDIKHVKIMLAHRLDYINAGYENTYAGTDYNALTVIIAGYDQNSNYVYTSAGSVLDNATPCPYQCIASGTAASDTFPQ